MLRRRRCLRLNLIIVVAEATTVGMVGVIIITTRPRLGCLVVDISHSRLITGMGTEVITPDLLPSSISLLSPLYRPSPKRLLRLAIRRPRHTDPALATATGRPKTNDSLAVDLDGREARRNRVRALTLRIIIIRLPINNSSPANDTTFLLHLNSRLPRLPADSPQQAQSARPISTRAPPSETTTTITDIRPRLLRTGGTTLLRPAEAKTVRRTPTQARA